MRLHHWCYSRVSKWSVKRRECPALWKRPAVIEHLFSPSPRAKAVRYTEWLSVRGAVHSRWSTRDRHYVPESVNCLNCRSFQNSVYKWCMQTWRSSKIVACRSSKGHKIVNSFKPKLNILSENKLWVGDHRSAQLIWHLTFPFYCKQANWCNFEVRELS